MDAEQVALIRTIAESPEDDVPRLVYCDWLEERGQFERAEFIRLQLELAHNPTESVKKRIGERILTRVQQWREAELPNFPGIIWGDYERGFVHSFTCYRRQGIASLADHHVRIVEVAPITSVRFYQRQDEAEELPFERLTPLSGVTHLELDLGETPAIRGLFRSAFVRTIRSVSVTWGVGGPILMDALAGATELRSLESLRLPSHSFTASRFIGRLLEAPCFPQLRTLEFVNLKLEGPAIAEFIRNRATG